MSDTPSLFDIMFTTRAMRRLHSYPVPDALIERILRAGQVAPNASNSQNWGFLVVKDSHVKTEVQKDYRKAFDEVSSKHYDESLDATSPGAARGKLMRQIEAVTYLTEHFHEVPVWIVPCLRVGPQGPTGISGASVYPAVQNMILAARALGLSTHTARHMVYGKEVDGIFGLSGRRVVRHPAHRLSYGDFRTGRPRTTKGLRSFGPVGPALPLNKGATLTVSQGPQMNRIDLAPNVSRQPS